MEGIILKALSGFYYVDCDGSILTCRGRGKLRHGGFTPLVGDRVSVTDQEDGTGMIDEILPRKNFFHRPAVANIDYLVIVASGATPITDPFLIDRLTAMAQHRNCQCVICFNKWDLSQPTKLWQLYRDAGFPALQVSAETGEGLEALSRIIAGKICAFTGNSGVGKSSLLNALKPGFSLPTGEVSERLGRGRHTTRHVELFPLSNGTLIADTPGFAAFEEGTFIPEELPSCFPEFQPFLDGCKYSSCSHVKENGCAVLSAIDTGTIAKSRHDSYVRLYNEAKEVQPWQRKKSH